MNVQSSRTRQGPPVFLDMDQQALDEAYDQEIWAPNRALIVERAARPRASGRARSARQCRSASPMGRPSIEGARHLRLRHRSAPINVFVHGGAWRRNVAADYALQAEPLVRAGAHCVIIDFINVDRGGRRPVPDVRAGAARLAWVARNAESFGGDRNRIYVSAHSSGSHLAGCVLTRGWREEGLPPTSSRARCCCPACTISSRCGCRSARPT